MQAEDELVAARWKVSVKTARFWIWLRWIMRTDRLLGDGWVCS